MLRIFCIPGLLLTMALGCSIAWADHDDRPSPAYRQDGRRPPLPRDDDHRRYAPRERDRSPEYRQPNRRYHRAHDQCARRFPEGSQRFDRCLQYQLSPGLYLDF